MANRVKGVAYGGSVIKVRQRESKPVSRQYFKLQSSDFEEVRVKLRQLGKGKQRVAMTVPAISTPNITIRKKENGNDRDI